MGHTLLADAAPGPISKVAANKDTAKTVPKKQSQEYELINRVPVFGAARAWYGWHRGSVDTEVVSLD